MTHQFVFQSSLFSCALALVLGLTPGSLEAGAGDKKPEAKQAQPDKPLNKDAKESTLEDIDKAFEELEKDIDALRDELKRARRDLVKKWRQHRKDISGLRSFDKSKAALEQFRKSLKKALKNDLKDIAKLRKAVQKGVKKDARSLRGKALKLFEGLIEKNGKGESFTKPKQFKKAQRRWQKWLDKFDSRSFRGQRSKGSSAHRESFKGVIQHNGKTMEFDDRERFDKAVKEIQREGPSRGNF
jgi:hypothetical protein